MTPADLIKKYIELRDWLEKDSAANSARQLPYLDAMKAIEGGLQQFLLANDGQNFKAEGIGTAFLQTKTHVRMADRNAFLDFIVKTGDPFSYFTNNVRKETVLDYVKEHGTPPAGIDLTSIQEVQIRRS